ncbi:MAG: hypothetical protein GVX78_04450 [Bacteroidetes bacterium]|jgi:hypothetical protein|nr:hypothetical protein [Bacteroidota bacterium]
MIKFGNLFSLILVVIMTVSCGETDSPEKHSSNSEFESPLIIDTLAFPSPKPLNLYDNLYPLTSLSKGKNNMIWIGTYAGVFGY